MMLNYLGIIKMNNNMKTFNVILSIVIAIIICSCSEFEQSDSSYDSVKKEETTSYVSVWETWHMYLYGTNGKKRSSCAVYKGEFDGHTWYVFYDNIAAPSVVHDPKCKCLEHNE